MLERVRGLIVGSWCLASRKVEVLVVDSRLTKGVDAVDPRPFRNGAGSVSFWVGIVRTAFAGT